MFNLGNVTSKNDNKIYRFLIIGPSGNGKINILLNLLQDNNIFQQDNNIIDKIYLYAKDLEEPKYQYLSRCRNKKIKRSSFY